MEPYIVNYANFMWTKLIDQNGNFHNSVHIKDAKNMAKTAGLDLVCFSNQTSDTSALCKIIDYGKWKYQQDKAKRKETNNHKIELKEIQFTPVIGEHDIEHKVRQIIKFLENGNEVVINMRFKGIHHRLISEGEKILSSILSQIGTHGKEISRKRSEDNIWLKMVKNS
jgi:translation initiation factor IF-3